MNNDISIQLKSDNKVGYEDTIGKVKPNDGLCL
jgi:hypothetical protein